MKCKAWWSRNICGFQWMLIMTMALRTVHSKQCPNHKYFVLKGEQKRNLEKVRTLKGGRQASHVNKLPMVWQPPDRAGPISKKASWRSSQYPERVGITVLTHPGAAWLKKVRPISNSWHVRSLVHTHSGRATSFCYPVTHNSITHSPKATQSGRGHPS